MKVTPIPRDPPTADPEYGMPDVMGRSFHEDCLVFDMADNGRILAARAPADRQRVGESFLSLLTASDRDALRTYMFSYDRRIAVLDSSIGIALILPHLMPEATLGVALIPHMKRKTLLRLLGKASLSRFLISDSLRAEACGRMTADMRAREADFQQILQDIAECFEQYPFPTDPFVGQTVFQAEEWLFRFSRFTGCPVHLLEHTLPTGTPDLNHSLYAVVVLLSLLLCRSNGSLREAFVFLEDRSGVATISLRIPIDSQFFSASPIVLWLDSLASRKNTLFEYSIFGSFLHLRFSPVTHDWAYLGIKEPTVFELQKEERNHKPTSQNDQKS